MPRSDRLLAHLNDFAERAGHDLCGPLNQANSLASLFAKRYRGRLDTDADTMLDHLANSASRMENLVEGLGKYLEAASRLPRREQTDLNKILSAALISLGGPIGKNSAVITSEPLPADEVAPARIRTLFEVLLANAIQFSQSGMPPRISVQASAADEFWRFSVCDRGIGIEPEEREAVFLPFRRLHGRNWPGPGLGLPTAQLIVESHGGKIHIEGPEGNGVCVVFTLPR